MSSDLVSSQSAAGHVVSLDPHLEAVWQAGEVPLMDGGRPQSQLEEKPELKPWILYVTIDT